MFKLHGSSPCVKMNYLRDYRRGANSGSVGLFQFKPMLLARFQKME